MKDQLIKLGNANPTLQPHIRKVLAALDSTPETKDASGAVSEIRSFPLEARRMFQTQLILTEKMFELPEHSLANILGLGSC